MPEARRKLNEKADQVFNAALRKFDDVTDKIYDSSAADKLDQAADALLWNPSPRTKKVGVGVAVLALLGAGAAYKLQPGPEKAERVGIERVFKHPDVYSGKKIDVSGYADYISSATHEKVANYVGANGVVSMNVHKVIDATYDLYPSPEMEGAHIRVTSTEKGAYLPIAVSPEPDVVKNDGPVDVIGTFSIETDSGKQTYTIRADSVRGQDDK